MLSKAKGDEDILAVILFGSAGRGELTETSDIDICLVLQGEVKDIMRAFSKRMEYLRFGRVDAHIFQHLPLYIRRRVLREGKVLFVRDEEALYELAFRTAQAFEDFKHIYYGYLEEVARA